MRAPGAYITVVGIDQGEQSHDVLTAAVELANQRGARVVHAVFVDGVHALTAYDLYVQDVSSRCDDALRFLDELAESVLQEQRARTPSLSVERVVALYRIGAPAEQIALLAEKLRADLIVVGTRGQRGIRRLLDGSVASGVVRVAPCAVFVERSTSRRDVSPHLRDHPLATEKGAQP